MLMKIFLALAIYISVSNLMAQDLSQVETCIAENSGAASITCLDSLYQKSEFDRQAMKKQLQASLRARLLKGDITQVHYDSALAALKKSWVEFASYRDSICLVIANYSGAVASGYQQIYLGCLIEKNQLQIKSTHSLITEYGSFQ
jgi:hypothetical protein